MTLSSTCSKPRCPRMQDGPDRLCQHHRMAERRQKGLCANCGGQRERRPVINSLTGRQLNRNGQPAFEMRCQQCGRVQSSRPARQA